MIWKDAEYVLFFKHLLQMHQNTMCQCVTRFTHTHIDKCLNTESHNRVSVRESFNRKKIQFHIVINKKTVAEFVENLQFVLKPFPINLGFIKA